jgi:predicted PurR-regulated permease PerM
MENKEQPIGLPPHRRSESPKWGSNTKMVVGITIVALIAALIIQFRQIIGPLLLTFILAFLMHPIANWLSTKTRLSWRMAVNLIYLVLVIALVGILTATGLALVQQVQGLIDFVNRFVNDLPSLVSDLASRVYQFGPFQFGFSQFDLTTLARQVLDILQPLVGQAGGLVSKLATTTATTFGWGFFVLLISYFWLSESSRLPSSLVPIEIPGYNADARRLGRELSNIWNAYLRGQMVISILTALAYTTVLTILGLRLTLAIALMAAAARFIPWIGPAITWIVTSLVALFQTSNHFGLSSIWYAVLVLGSCLILDQIFDYLIVPRVLGRTLGVHPAGVLIAAIVISNLIGIVGLVLAAPVLATVMLVGRYVVRKMLDLNPWPEREKPQADMPGTHTIRRLKIWLSTRRRTIR